MAPNRAHRRRGCRSRRAFQTENTAARNRTREVQHAKSDRSQRLVQRARPGCPLQTAETVKIRPDRTSNARTIDRAVAWFALRAMLHDSDKNAHTPVYLASIFGGSGGGGQVFVYPQCNAERTRSHTSTSRHESPSWPPSRAENRY